MSPAAGRARAVTRRSLVLAVVPVLASLLSLSNVRRAMAADAGTGVTFPLPAGLPTVWTYTSLPGIGRAGAVVHTPGSDVVSGVGLVLVWLLTTAVLEAGFVGALWSRLDGGPLAFGAGVRRFTVRMIGAEVVRFGAIVAAIPLFLTFSAGGILLGFVVAAVLSYLVYGLPFVIVARDLRVVPALRESARLATDGGRYARFAVAHVLYGAGGSLIVTTAVRNGGLPGILLGAALVAVPAVFVSAYGLVVFDDICSTRPADPTARGTGHDHVSDS